jgi:hypothetical protein
MRAMMQVARAARRVESLSANTQRTGVSAMSMPLRRALTPSTATGVRSVHSTAVVRAGISNKHVDTPDNNADTPFEFSETSQKEIAFILSKYPGNYKMSAVIPILWVAQKQTDGWLPLAAMNKTAEICQMSPILVYEVATFYTMFNRCVLRASYTYVHDVTSQIYVATPGRRSASTTYRCARRRLAWSWAHTMF